MRESLEDIAERVIGPRWRREAALPVGPPAHDPVEALAAPPHRFASLRALRTHARTGALVTNALSRPANLSVAAGVAVAAWFSTPWLLVVAAAVYVALVSITFFDEAEAARIRRRA